jgi:diguanylate cyclase (GGDEF)-like protein
MRVRCVRRPRAVGSVAYALRFNEFRHLSRTEAPTIEGSRVEVTKQKVLVVEDETNLRDVLRIQLESDGFQVLTAKDGREALEVAVKGLPDIVLLDVMLPHVDGYEVCRRLRGTFATHHIPIIMLTAKAEIDGRLQGLEGGANDYISKPWERRELLLRVRNALNWSRQQRAASPLTGLPGNVSINEELARRLSLGKPFAMLQIDIDYFKAFNDYYGYSRGDQAIQTLARILVESAHRFGTGNFIGHIGGDDFVVLTTPEAAEPLGEAIIAGFVETVKTLYDPEDQERGYVEVRNRRHAIERFPLMSVTIAMVSTNRHAVSHLAQLIDIAGELKAHGKGIPGSVLVGERRRTAEPPAEAEKDVA